MVGKLTELIINHIVSTSTGQIKAGAARKDTRYAISAQMNLYRADFQPEPVLRLNAKLGCMTVVAARFKPASANCTAAYVPKQLTRETMKLPESAWKSPRTDNSVENQLRRANICVDGKARAVYEARFEFSEDGTAYRLKNAGYQIHSLLTTQDKAATRTTFYTLEISQPSKSGASRDLIHRLGAPGHRERRRARERPGGRPAAVVDRAGPVDRGATRATRRRPRFSSRSWAKSMRSSAP